MPLSLLIERPFALAWSTFRRLSIGAVFIMATFSSFGSALAQTDEIYTRGEDRRDAQDNGDGPFCGPGTVAPFPAGYDSPPDRYPAGDRCAGELNTRGYYWKCGPSCNAKWMYCWRSPHWTGPPPACDTIVTISGDEPSADGSSPPSSGEDTVSTGGGGSVSGGGSGSSGGGDCVPPDTLPYKARWSWYQAHCLAQASPQQPDPTKEPLKGHIYYNCEPFYGQPDVPPDIYQQLMQLAAAMDRITTDIGNKGVLATDHFFQGLGEWTSEMATFLAQRPGLPAQQIAEAITAYLLNDNAANHHMLYETAEGALQALKDDPARFCGKNLPNVAPITGPAKLRMVKRLLDGSKRMEKVYVYGSGFSPLKCTIGKQDCFWQTMASATGDYRYLKQTAAATPEQIMPELKHRFGGPNAKEPLTGRVDDLAAFAEGIPVPVTVDEFVSVLNKASDGFRGMVFVKKIDQTGHVFEVTKFKGQTLFWDNQQRTSNLDIMTAGGKEMYYYRFQ